jgi:hypothetical protein
METAHCSMAGPWGDATRPQDLDATSPDRVCNGAQTDRQEIRLGQIPRSEADALVRQLAAVIG